MKKLANHDVFNGKEKIFNVSVYKDGAWISDYGNTWKLFFRTGTHECGFLSYLIEKKDDYSVELLVRTMWLSRTAFRSYEVINAIYSSVDEHFKNTTTSDNAEDAKILAEEKVMHEQTLESIEGLEKLKSNGK